MKIIKTLSPQNFNHKVYPIDNAVSSTFTHTIGIDKIDFKSILVLAELTSDLFLPILTLFMGSPITKVGFPSLVCLQVC